MDSLLASYASSDEEDEQKESKSQNPAPTQQSKSTAKTLFSPLPPPKSSSSSSSSSSSLLFSLPRPKPHLPNPSSISSSSSSPLISNHSKGEDEERWQSAQNVETAPQLSSSLPKPSTSFFFSLRKPKSSSCSSLFSSLPQPKTHNTDSLHSSPVVPAKRVVPFRPPPINPPSSSSAGGDDEDDEDEDEDEKQKKKRQTIQTSSVKSFLSSIPAPRNSATLGASSSGSGTGRRSIIDADVRGLKNSNVVGTATDNEAGVSGYYESRSGVDQSSTSSSGGVSESSGYAVTGGASDYSNWPSGTENYADYGGYAGYDGVSGDYQNGDYVSYDNGYGNYANYGQGQYESYPAYDSSASVVPEVSGLAEGAFKVSGKRGRNNVPQEIVEVKQDELIKNRPREDQVKLTGIAFGPSYQVTHLCFFCPFEVVSLI